MTKVLLVEDDNNLREIYEARLTAEGYEISTAQDGEEALVVAKQIKPDLVISDVMMPKISGFEMLDILRNTPGLEHVKVIMLTALGQGEDRDRADSLGANKYLVKSQVTLEDIVKTAQELLGGDDESLPSGIAQDTPPSVAAEPVATEPSMAAEPVTAEPVAATTPVAEPPAAPAAEMPAEPAMAATPVATPTEPPAAPTPEPIPDSSAVLPSAASEAENGSTAQEAALVEQQIDSFAQQAVAAAPEATPAVAETEAASAATPTDPVTTPVTSEEPAASSPSDSDSNAAADDKLMADAVEQLSGNEAAEPEPSPVVPAPGPAPEPSVTEPVVAPEPAETVESSAASNVVISGKKVIQPLNDTETKPDIHELLAREEANSAATPTAATTSSEPAVPPVAEQPVEPPAPQPNPVATPEPAPVAQSTSPAPAEPAPATPPAGDSSTVDPNSIAL